MAKARKDIDKESMYQKIMPSAMRSASLAAENAEPQKKAATQKSPARSTPRKSPAKAAPPPMPEEAAAPEPAAVRQGMPAPSMPTAPAPPMPAAPTPAAPPYKVAAAPVAEAKPSIVNIMELLIDTKIDIAMEKFHCCTCDKCRQDIAAMALNKLHPKYIVAEPDQLTIGMEDKDANTQVTTALVQAILKVKSNPKH